ncbi:MAG: hypothetical protein HUJ86_01570, partial [Synergistes sp.]|nr:hypothetical protein [Synergistes sp.]
KAVRSDGKTVDADKLIVHEDTHLVEAKGNSKLVFIVNEKDKKKDPAAKGAQKPAAGAAAKKDNKPADSGAKKNSAPSAGKEGGAKQSTDGKKSSLSEADENWVKKQ